MSISNSSFQKARDLITKKTEEIIAFSDYIGLHPEISEQEYETSRMMADKLKEAGFRVEYPYLDIPTAFSGVKVSGDNADKTKPVVAVMVEYDALPDIGHGCGHNLHGTMALYAGLAVADAMSDFPGELRIIGTPAEETDGAKATMAEKGIFDDVDLALMFHSFSHETFVDYKALGIDGYEFTFKGTTAHSAAAPWSGRSAQNGMLLFIDALNMMRLHMHDFCRMHYIVKEVHGAINVIPDLAVCWVETRAPEKRMLKSLTEYVRDCAKGSALATHTEVSWKKFMKSFDSMLCNHTAEKLAEDTLLEYGITCTHGHGPDGSTDVGNVSYRCPAIQPEFAITKKTLELHTRDFAAATMSEEGHKALIQGTRVMADICLKIFMDEKLRNSIREEFLHASA